MNKKKLTANHVSPSIHNEVTKQMTNPEGNSSKILLSQEEFVIAKRLLADLPVVPTNERLYELVQDIHMGIFDDISSVEEADENWEAWKQRTSELLKSRGILVASRLKKVRIKQN